MDTLQSIKEPLVSLDLHFHSNASDGNFSAEELASMLAHAGVQYAALTDHLTLKNLSAFQAAAKPLGIFVFSGAELHGIFEGKDLHILAYGFKPESQSIQNCLSPSRSVKDILQMIHAAGGLAFLAHPLHYNWTDSELMAAVHSLARIGLDGLEVFYTPYTKSEQNKLLALADQQNLLTSGGSDFHGTAARNAALGVQMPVSRWKHFREALGEHARNSSATETELPNNSNKAQVSLNWKWLFSRIMLPSFMVISVFIALIFAVLIPGFERLLLEKQRETTTELTNSAWSILQDYHEDFETEKLSLHEAQSLAIARIRQLRYGPDSKDYFWLTDMHPYMLMHPYRQDLQGEDLREFQDPDGIKPFLEFVNKVETHRSGFVRYIWQWQDDPDRMEAKESYVRGFEPWGWIIGTGLYVDDVQVKIEALTRDMIDLSFLVTILSACLLLLISSQSLKLERKRSLAEQKLRVSHERYRALVESSSSGILLLLDGRCTFANQTLLDMLGYSETELSLLDIHDILAIRNGLPDKAMLDSIMDGGDVVKAFESHVQCKNGKIVKVLLSANPVFISQRQGVILSMHDITQHQIRQNEIERDKLISQLQTSLLYLTEPVSKSMTPAPSCSSTSNILHAVQVMNKAKSSAVAVISPTQDLLGIVTDHDIRQRVVGANMDTTSPVSRIMSAPVIAIDENAPVFEAVLMEHEHKIDHLAVIDSAHKLLGFIRGSQTIRPDQYSPVVLTQQIRTADSIDALAECHARLPVLASSLIETGALAQNICQICSTATDAISTRVIELTLKELGPAPVPFAFLALGSEARQEQTLATDQDNALIYIDSEAESSQNAEYFFRLGTLVCDRLNSIGYKYCGGNNMAKNRQWNQPLKQWRQYYQQWITEPDDEALAYCQVFFDQRCIYGDYGILTELREHINLFLTRHPSFYQHMALNTMQYKVPISVFGRIVTDSAGTHSHSLNIKDAMLPVSNFARLYALKENIDAVNTQERLDQLFHQNSIQEDSFRSISQAYNHLMQLRLKHQARQLQEGKKADNYINLETLTQIDESMLKNTLSQISVIQKKVAYDFHVSAV